MGGEVNEGFETLGFCSGGNMEKLGDLRQDGRDGGNRSGGNMKLYPGVDFGVNLLNGLTYLMG